MIKIFNSAYPSTDTRRLSLDEVQIRSQKMDYDGKPYILFDHKDFPLGSLRADFNGVEWVCDLD